MRFLDPGICKNAISYVILDLRKGYRFIIPICFLYSVSPEPISNSIHECLFILCIAYIYHYASFTRECHGTATLQTQSRSIYDVIGHRSTCVYYFYHGFGIKAFEGCHIRNLNKNWKNDWSWAGRLVLIVRTALVCLILKMKSWILSKYMHALSSSDVGTCTCTIEYTLL